MQNLETSNAFIRVFRIIIAQLNNYVRHINLQTVDSESVLNAFSSSKGIDLNRLAFAELWHQSEAALPFDDGS